MSKNLDSGQLDDAEVACRRLAVSADVAAWAGSLFDRVVASVLQKPRFYCPGWSPPMTRINMTPLRLTSIQLCPSGACARMW